MAAEADLVVAHNVAFDRRFVKRLSAPFSAKPWACSMSEVDWAKEGHEGTKLAYLAMGAGFFYERHRAANDCIAAIELLATHLPSTVKPAMERLLDRARRPTWCIFGQKCAVRTKGRAQGARLSLERGRSRHSESLVRRRRGRGPGARIGIPACLDLAARRRAEDPANRGARAVLGPGMRSKLWNGPCGAFRSWAGSCAATARHPLSNGRRRL
jgi:hypothetical protein